MLADCCSVAAEMVSVWLLTFLLNPGKAVPSLHRCAEYGRMHVHHGEVKFPELERF